MWSSSSSSLSSAALQVQPGPIPTTDPRASVVSGGFVGFSVALHSLLCFPFKFHDSELFPRSSRGHRLICAGGAPPPPF